MKGLFCGRVNTPINDEISRHTAQGGGWREGGVNVSIINLISLQTQPVPLLNNPPQLPRVSLRGEMDAYARHVERCQFVRLLTDTVQPCSPQKSSNDELKPLLPRIDQLFMNKATLKLYLFTQGNAEPQLPGASFQIAVTSRK